MSENQSTYNKLIKHLDQSSIPKENWSKEEKEIFEELLLVKQASRANALDSKLSFLKAVDNESMTISEPTKRYLWPVSIAASLLLILGFYFFNSNALSGNEKLFADHFEVYPELTQFRGSEKNERSKAALLYNTDQFKKAAIAYQNLYLNDPKQDYLFYAAVAYLANENPSKALDLFKELGTSEKLPLNYYKGLTNLRLNNSEAAKINLSKVNPTFTFYKSKADLLLKELDSE